VTGKESNGRCPDCGEWVAIIVRAGMPAEIPPHGCRARACEYPGCPVTRFMDEMVQSKSGCWHCPRHGLLVAAKDLIALYQVEGDADWTAISEIIGEQLPEIVKKVEAFRPFHREART
jgi:hypothetical protein